MNLPRRNSSIIVSSTMDFTPDTISSQSFKTNNLISKNKTRNHLKKETKFCLYSIVLLCAISLQTANAIPLRTAGQRLNLHTQEYRERRYQQLLKEQRSLVVPTPHRHHLHHRSVGKMPEMSPERNDAVNHSDYCQAIDNARETIERACKQANATFYNFYTILGKYTKAKHNDTLDSFYEKWSKHSLQLEHPYAQYLNYDINDPPNKKKQPAHLVDKELTKETLKAEFLNINETLRMLELVYNENNEERQRSRNRFDLRRENESDEEFQDRVNIIDKTYDDILMNLGQDLYYTQKILQELNVEPQPEFKVSYNRDAQQIEWLLFHEHFSVMKYFVETYTYLLEHCNKVS